MIIMRNILLKKLKELIKQITIPFDYRSIDKTLEIVDVQQLRAEKENSWGF